MQGPQGLNKLILLASSSPRRKELLEGAGFRTKLVHPGPEQECGEGEDPESYVCGQAKTKARGAQVGVLEGNLAGALEGVLMSGDTVVSLEGRILGKPLDASEAEGMLKRLMGRTHEVWSAIAMLRVEGGRVLPETLVCGVSCAQVRFGRVPELALEAYLEGEEWKDKAGAYGIQGWAGAYTELVKGDLDTVVGLPMQLFWSLWGALTGE